MARRTAVLNEKLNLKFTLRDTDQADRAFKVLEEYGMALLSRDPLRAEGPVPQELVGLAEVEISLRLLEEIEAAGIGMKSSDAELGEQHWIDSVSIEGSVVRPK